MKEQGNNPCELACIFISYLLSTSICNNSYHNTTNLALISQCITPTYTQKILNPKGFKTKMVHYLHINLRLVSHKIMNQVLSATDCLILSRDDALGQILL